MTIDRNKLLFAAVLIGAGLFLPLSSNATDVARWKVGETGEWTTDTNDWQGATDSPLPSPGYGQPCNQIAKGKPEPQARVRKGWN